MLGCSFGELFVIPHIPSIPSVYHFQFKRLQFATAVYGAMTVFEHLRRRSKGRLLKISHGLFQGLSDGLVILHPEWEKIGYVLVYEDVLQRFNLLYIYRYSINLV